MEQEIRNGRQKMRGNQQILPETYCKYIHLIFPVILPSKETTAISQGKCTLQKIEYPDLLRTAVQV